MRCKTLILTGIALAYVSPALAHHSFAMFDAEKKVTLEGTIKEFQWTNPHSWILIMVPDAQGTPSQWGIEMGGPASLARQGWVPNTLTSGMKVTAVIHPLKDGNRGGQYVAVTLPDGTTKGNPKRVPNADAGASPARAAAAGGA